MPPVLRLPCNGPWPHSNQVAHQRQPTGVSAMPPSPTPATQRIMALQRPSAPPKPQRRKCRDAGLWRGGCWQVRHLVTLRRCSARWTLSGRRTPQLPHNLSGRWTPFSGQPFHGCFWRFAENHMAQHRRNMDPEIPSMDAFERLWRVAWGPF